MEESVGIVGAVVKACTVLVEGYVRQYSVRFRIETGWDGEEVGTGYGWKYVGHVVYGGAVLGELFQDGG